MLDNGPGLYLAISGLVVAVLSYCRKYLFNHPRLPLPPGPTPLPVLGNVLNLDSALADLQCLEIQICKPVLVVNSEEVVKDLFDQRSSIYSDRPQSIAYGAPAPDFNTVFMPYGNRWRLHRRIFHQAFNQAATPALHAMQLRSAHNMLFNLLQDPSNYPRCRSQQVVRSRAEADFYQVYFDIHAVYNIFEGFAPAAMMLIETFPFPGFPVPQFKRASLKCDQAGHDVKEIPIQYVKERMSANDMGPCSVADALNRSSQEDDVNTTAVKEAASVAFTAATETTTATLLVFCLAMVLNPEVQAKAQADIDLVVGKDRLPNFEDRPALPYVEAILRETLRWHPVIPITSDVYNGYFIPKGVVVFSNAWKAPTTLILNNEPFRAMTHDATKYPSLDEFKPERFVQDDGSLNSDTMRLGFGWDRRICVGRHVVDASLWVAMANFLAFSPVHKALDEHGIEIPVVAKFTTGFTVFIEFHLSQRLVCWRHFPVAFSRDALVCL
ncbi:cytochrome P450 [Suillus americanus]|nr:cytochrome P450 [Suillus americanus]